MPIERHIFISSGFDEVCFKFLEKLADFHKFFVKDIIVHGDNFDLLNMLDMNVEYNQDYDESFFLNFLPELLSSEELIEICHDNGSSSNTCNIHYLNNNQNTEGFYMTEGFKDIDFEESSLKIYKLKNECNLLSINNFWLE